MATRAALDLLVVGGGSGGLGCARRASQLGAKVAIVEHGRLGGTCVNVGCVPKKVMFNTAMHAEIMHDHPDYGFTVSDYKFSWGTIKKSRDAYVKRLNEIYRKNLEKDKVEYIAGHATFKGPKEVVVGDTTYTAEHVLIATGTKPMYPSSTPGYEYGISSDGFFELEDLPKKTVVVGSGYIAVELAGILNALGSDVTLVIRYHKALRSFDSMLSDELMVDMAEAGIKIAKFSKVSEVKKVNDTLSVSLVPNTPEGQPQDITSVNCLLWAIGRDANCVNLGLDATGVELDKKGFVKVDEYQNTSVKNVYALGCWGYKSLESSRDCVCTHPPGQHRKGSTHDLASPNVGHDLLPKDIDTLHISRPLYPEYQRRKPHLEETLHIPEKKGPFCIKCGVNKVFYDPQLGEYFKYCTPKCRNEDLLQQNALSIEQEITTMEKKLHQKMEDTNLQKYIEIKSAPRPKTNSYGASESAAIKSKATTYAAACKTTLTTGSNSKQGLQKEDVNIYRYWGFKSFGLLLAETPISTDEGNGLEIIGLIRHTDGGSVIKDDKIRFFDIILKVNKHQLLQASDLDKIEHRTQATLTCVKRNKVSCMRSILTHTELYCCTHVFGLHCVKYMYDDTVKIGLTVVLSGYEVPIVGIEKGSLSRQSGLQCNDVVIGFTTTKRNGSFNEVTYQYRGPLSQYFEKLQRCLQDAEKGNFNVILFIKRPYNIPLIA